MKKMEQPVEGTNGKEGTATAPDGERARRAYSAAGDFLRAKLIQEQPEDLKDLESVEQSDIVVVQGIYDHVEQVLEAMHTSFTLISPAHLDRLELRPEQLLVINCPGHISRRAVGLVRAFVEKGGSLFTTDWALRHVIEPAFPGVLAYNERPTADDVVRIEIGAHENPFLAGVLEQGSDPLWWLESSSYPIKILAPEKVQVLLSSRELATKYGESPVAVVFQWGQGEVFHMISHYYLQRTELRSARQAAPASAYAVEMGVGSAMAGLSEKMEGLTTADVESAYSSVKLMQNVIVAKKRQGRMKTDPEGGRGSRA